ncbi:ABC transporter ATP-binding protein [Nitrospirota bacterium]
MSLLELDSLNIELSSSTGPINVVSDLSLSIKKGEIFGLAGESGCGKSLTALAIMGILPEVMTASGAIRFNDRELIGMEESALRKLRGAEMAMIFQEPMTSLNPVLRIGYQIEESINTHLNVTGREARRIALGLLRSVHIPSPEVRIREYPHQLSGGMRQRVMIAMAISCSPALLIADEPTTALDVTIEAQILSLLRELRDTKGMGMLLITHDLGVIAENAERVAIMYAGRIVEQAPVKRLFEAPAHPYTVGLLRSLPEVRGQALSPIPGLVPKPDQLPEGCKFNDRCSYALDDCTRKEPHLVKADGNEGHTTRCIRAAERPWQ